MTLDNFKKAFFVSTGPDWWSEIWADWQIWAPHRQSDEKPGLPRRQRNPRCNQSKTLTALYNLEAIFLSFYRLLNLILWFQGAGTDEKCLIEVLVSRNNRQIHEMVAAYKDGKTNSRVRVGRLCFTPASVSVAYGSDLEEDVIGDTSGHFKKMLVVLLQVSSPPDIPYQRPVLFQPFSALCSVV